MKKLYILLAPAIFTLSACGGAPSESQMKAAYQKTIDESPISQMAKMEVTSMKKIDCKEDGAKAYRCEVEIAIKTSATEQKMKVPMQFVKGPDGWRASVVLGS